MILVLLGICILMIVVGAVIYDRTDYNGPGELVGQSLTIFGVVFCVICVIAILALLVVVSGGPVIDDKIAMYEAENAAIEEEVSAIVQNYQDYESEVFANAAVESPITLVSLYPELKSDELVKSQIDIYVANNEKIKALKEEQIDYKVVRWWLYFGK